MSSRLQASCLSLLIALAVICVASHKATADRQSFVPQPVASHAALPLQQSPVLYYGAEPWLQQQPTMAAHTRAPFVNVFAIYRRGLPDVLRQRAREEATPDVTTHHFLLTGQQTAALASAQAGDVLS
ncbi:MAG TPA: hypothetical protein VGS57_15990 [Thermoanaerobaculia bacterium]|jgi:hypothetical protein|nr:hypothetical protein [Thermoanaerobaculia bacterium]